MRGKKTGILPTAKEWYLYLPCHPAAKWRFSSFKNWRKKETLRFAQSDRKRCERENSSPTAEW